MTSIQSQQNAERRYHDTGAAYALPNDNIEHARLEGQANHIRELMQGQSIHAPLSAPTVHKALDIGCGTGTVTHEIASQLPNTQVYGIDLSPVPNIREKLPNIEYVQANFNEVTAAHEPDSRFKKGSFDFAFSRLLVAGMIDWKDYVKRCVGLVKPGGWVEMHDLDVSLHRVPEPTTPEARAALYPHTIALSELESKAHPADAMLVNEPWCTTFQDLCAAKGMDATCGRQLPRWFSEAGLEDVQIMRYMYPMGLWEGMTDVEKRFAVHHRDGMGTHMSEVIRKMSEGQNAVSREDVERAIEGGDKEVERWDRNRGFVFLYVVCGRKPSQ